MTLYDEIQSAVEYVRTKSERAPTVGVVLGSGLGAFTSRIESGDRVPYGDIPHFPASTVTGHAGELWLGEIGRASCAVMSGRVHYYEGHDMQRVTFPVRVLAGLGVKSLVITNAAGSVNPAFDPGDFMVIQDHLNLTGSNPLLGPNDDRLGPRFPDVSRVYASGGQEILREAAGKVGAKLREGIYCGLSGPSYETPAEIQMLQRMGADAVGMSTVAEVIVAAHAGLQVAGLSVITNRAAGLSEHPLTHDEVKEIGQRVEGLLGDLLAEAVQALA